MSGWGLFWVGLGTAVLSARYGQRQAPLSADASWWKRSSRSYSEWKGSWRPVMVPVGLVIAVIGLFMGLSHGH